VFRYPSSANTFTSRSLPLLDTDETTVPTVPLPLPSPSFAPLPPVDVLAHPEEDAGTMFRHSGWAAQRRRVAAALAAAFPETARLDRFSNCGRDAWVVQHPNRPRDFRVMANYCRDRYCVPCAAMRGRLLASNLLDAIGDRPIRMITLTLRSEAGDPLKPLLDRLYQSFARLRRTAFWGEHVTGGAALLEIKFIGRTRRWHPHLHILANGKFVPRGRLAGEWQRITGDSYIVDVRPVRDRGHAAHYLTKYVSKPADPSASRSHDLLLELVRACHGRRLCSTFGNWSGIELLRHDPPVEWIFITTLGVLQQRARDGDAESQQILRSLRATEPLDADPQRDLPYPDT